MITKNSRSMYMGIDGGYKKQPQIVWQTLNTTTMPVYMDRHDVSGKVTAAQLAELHELDLEVQYKFHCRALTYWFDEKHKAAFCLIEAPCEQAIVDMHMEAHGDLPGKIIQVDPAEVKDYLGRIKDVPLTDDATVNRIQQSAFRVVMVMGIDDCTIKPNPVKTEDCMSMLKDIFPGFYGRLVKVGRSSLFVSFPNATQCILCALEVHSQLSQINQALQCNDIKIKTGISAGFAVGNGASLFEDARKEARALYYVSDGNIAVAPEVKSLYEEENPEVYLEHDLFLTPSPSDQKFLVPLLDYLDETWQNPSLRVEDLEKSLGYSKSQLYRKIVSLLGETPNNFIKNYRLRKALKRIQKQSESITEIAGNTGFKSPSYFAKCFQKRYGVLPSVYMQQGLA